jgi:hypothetical protein
MKATDFSLIRYDADEGKVFDWKEPRFIEDENGEQVQEHLYVKTLFIGGNDAITNYVEVDESGIATELDEAEFADRLDYEAALAELGVE